MTTSELRLMIVKALRDAWTEVVENKKTIYRAFEKTGISLKTDGSEDGEKMHFQGQPVGVPEGLVYEAESEVGEG